jgi:hypothetical protein
MTPLSNKNKNKILNIAPVETSQNIEEYISILNKNCYNSINSLKKTISINSNNTIHLPLQINKKITEDNIQIPTMETLYMLFQYKYTVNQLKTFSKHYKLKVNGNKNELLNRIYSFLYFSKYIIKIQKLFRGDLVRRYKNLRGPAISNRKLCTNSNDFITMEPLDEIPFVYFFSYKSADDFVYGFDISSLYNVILKSKDTNTIQNPYNRKDIPGTVIQNIKQIIKLSKILRIPLKLTYNDSVSPHSFEKTIELKALSLFQNIDSLGNYSDCSWFLVLDRQQIIRFIRELSEIWHYRSQITNEIKEKICPPLGNPFSHLSMNYVNNEPNIYNVKKVVLDLLEKFVNTGVDKDSKTLGAYYVLGALTLVNNNAAIALPWLFQSFSYF